MRTEDLSDLEAVEVRRSMAAVFGRVLFAVIEIIAGWAILEGVFANLDGRRSIPPVFGWPVVVHGGLLF